MKGEKRSGLGYRSFVFKQFGDSPLFFYALRLTVICAVGLERAGFSGLCQRLHPEDVVVLYYANTTCLYCDNLHSDLVRQNLRPMASKLGSSSSYSVQCDPDDGIELKRTA